MNVEKIVPFKTLDNLKEALLIKQKLEKVNIISYITDIKDQSKSNSVQNTKPLYRLYLSDQDVVFADQMLITVPEYNQNETMYEKKGFLKILAGISIFN